MSMGSAEDSVANPMGPSRQRAARLVAVALGLYVLGFLLFYPSVPSVKDSVKYLEQSYIYSQGMTCFSQVYPVDGAEHCALPARYLPGTATAMLPFVWLFGWKGGFLLSLLSLVVGVGVTARWLQSQGRNPLFALMILGYPSALVFGRIAMSDMPSLALASIGLWLFWTRAERAPAMAALVGLTASVALQFRETNVLVFFVLFAGALLRREAGVIPLILGGAAGLVLRPLGTWIAFGDPFFTFPHGPTFALAHVPENLPIYALTLLVFVPGGALGALAYRGERRPEVVLTLLAFVGVYLAYGYSGAQSGIVRQLLLAPRYFMPLVPLLVFACAESFPRWVEAARDRLSPDGQVRFSAWVYNGVRLWVAGILLGSFLVHPAHSMYNADYVRVQEELYANTPEGSVIVFNSRGLRKYLNRLFGGRSFARRQRLTDPDIEMLLQRHGEFYLALMDRVGSEELERQAGFNADFRHRVAALAEMTPVFEGPGGRGETLRIWHVEPAAAAP